MSRDSSDFGEQAKPVA